MIVFALDRLEKAAIGSDADLLILMVSAKFSFLLEKVIFNVSTVNL